MHSHADGPMWCIDFCHCTCCAASTATTRHDWAHGSVKQKAAPFALDLTAALATPMRFACFPEVELHVATICLDIISLAVRAFDRLLCDSYLSAASVRRPVRDGHKR
jgi:hypothetical protein